MYASRSAFKPHTAKSGAVVLVATALALCVVAGAPSPAEGQGAAPSGAHPVAFHLTVGHLSPKPGPVDPELESIHRILIKEFRYESMRVLKTRELRLQLEEVGGILLPTGKRVQIRPMHLGKRGVLVAVDIEDGGQLDLRVPNRRPVVLGTDSYDGGKLFFTLQPDY